MVIESTHEYQFPWDSGETYYTPVAADKYDGITFLAGMRHFREPGGASSSMPDRYDAGYRYCLIPTPDGGTAYVEFTLPARYVRFSLVGLDMDDACQVLIFDSAGNTVVDELSGPRTNSPLTTGYDTELTYDFGSRYSAHQLMVVSMGDPSGYAFDDLTIICGQAEQEQEFGSASRMFAQMFGSWKKE